MESLACLEIFELTKQELVGIQATFVANHGIFGTLVLVFFVDLLTFLVRHVVDHDLGIDPSFKFLHKFLFVTH